MSESPRAASQSLDRRVELVAEVGVSHEGDAQTARRLVGELCRTGVLTAIKFQIYTPHRFVGNADAQRRDRVARFALPEGLLAELTGMARDHGVVAFSTLLSDDVASLLMCQHRWVKIASSDITTLPLIRQAASGFDRVMISTGACTMDDITRAVAVVEQAAFPVALRQRLTLLHCVSGYPVPEDQANLAMIGALQQRFNGVTVGYSHHVLGTDALEMAVVLGARMLEVHATWDRTRTTFRDHALALEPSDFCSLGRRIEELLRIRGDGVKRVMPVEEEALEAIRRSVIVVTDLPRGTRLRPVHLTTARPAGGVRAAQQESLYGRVLSHAKQAGDPIMPDDVDPSFA